jgi:hypothetical protein
VRLFLGKSRVEVICPVYTRSENALAAIPPALQSGDMQDAAFGVHLVQLEAARFGDAQAMPEYQEQQATVAGFVPAAAGRLDELFHFEAGEVLAVAALAPMLLDGRDSNPRYPFG